MSRAGVLVVLLVGCGAVKLEQPLAASDGGSIDAATEPVRTADDSLPAPHSDSGREAAIETSSLPEPAPDGAAELAPQPLPPCPAISHLEACPHGGTVAGKVYAYCYTNCAPVVACDNNNGACVANCGDCR